MASGNPLVHRERRLARSKSAWVRSFACEQLRPLIVCRGPVRKEAIDVFREMGMTEIGILLSHKDSIVFPHALAPELRQLDPKAVHHIPDYSGATKEERNERIRNIVDIARRHRYNAVFAGYGFMAEDESFVRAIEEAGLTFIGPNSATVHSAGKKDEAKRTARLQDASVTPGVDDITTRLVIDKWPTHPELVAAANAHGLALGPAASTGDLPLRDLAYALIVSAHRKGVDLYTVDEVAQKVASEVEALLSQHPGRRFRLKAVGGGGGKGQRIVDENSPVADRAREVLSEVKATGVGDDKNMLIEMNVESTRHLEIQLLGNGDWCISLGGRDCSLQMHEQKLLEVSATQEDYTRTIDQVRQEGRHEAVKALQVDRRLLQQMESEAARFGRAVGLDSASTFECIVEGDHHYFMEVNTRIQVEHRVTEMCYTLRFRNPNDRTDYFEVTSLVEAMALIARHKKRLPEPERCPRFGAGVEARLNATDDALQPHAGGTILSWSAPIKNEIRDDQGICQRNPDTGLFMRYKVAGAYDSNIALLVTHGKNRQDAYDELSEILRLTRLRGTDVSTNLAFHYGLVSWLRGNEPLARPTTEFVKPYLTQVGRTFRAAMDLDADHAWSLLADHHSGRASDSPRGSPHKNAVEILMRQKRTLVVRPVNALLSQPHLLAGWLSLRRKQLDLDTPRARWRINPLEVLQDTYRELNMDRRGESPAAYTIWNHDDEILRDGLDFYRAASERLGTQDYKELAARLESHDAPTDFTKERWLGVRGAHRGHQMGLELLLALAEIGIQSKFYDLRARPDLTIEIPKDLLDDHQQAAMQRVLSPPPPTQANEIVAASGGMYYGQEGPGRPPFVAKGTHFAAGDTLYIIEVMKMFNRVPAPFAGTIDEVLMQGGDGTIVHKGQPLFRVTPDEQIEVSDSAEVDLHRRTETERLITRLLGAN